MSLPVQQIHEYRVTWQHRRHADWRDSDGWVFRSDDPMWIEWTPSPEPDDGDLYDGVPNGIEGIVEASRREAVRAGHKGVRVEVREVSAWRITTTEKENQNDPV